MQRLRYDRLICDCKDRFANFNNVHKAETSRWIDYFVYDYEEYEITLMLNLKH